jgi:HAMP domain-containing protein
MRLLFDIGASMAQYKRRLIPIVDRRFQFKYTGIIVAIAAVVSTVLGVFLLRSYWEMNEVIDLASLSPEVNDKLNSDDARFVFALTLAFLVLEVVGLGVMGLIITHRVVGPVYVLQRHLTTILEGKYPVMRPLRQNDEFREAFEAFKAVVDQMKARDSSDLEKLKAAHASAKARGASDSELKPLNDLIAEREARVAPKEG